MVIDFRFGHFWPLESGFLMRKSEKWGPEAMKPLKLRKQVLFSEVLIHLWDLLLWLLNAFLEEKVWSHTSHEMHIPSRWLASMWYFIKEASPSFPHNLQTRETSCLGVPSACLPDGIFFWPFSIMDLTFSSSAWRSALISLATATVDFVFGALSWVLD